MIRITIGLWGSDVSSCGSVPVFCDTNEFVSAPANALYAVVAGVLVRITEPGAGTGSNQDSTAPAAGSGHTLGRCARTTSKCWAPRLRSDNCRQGSESELDARTTWRQTNDRRVSRSGVE